MRQNAGRADFLGLGVRLWPVSAAVAVAVAVAVAGAAASLPQPAKKLQVSRLT